MITVEAHGGFSKTESFFEKVKEAVHLGELDRYGRAGVAALESATPKRTGKTAASWQYDIVRKDGEVTIEWYNTNIQNGVNIAVILQYGHGTRNGGYVRGRDYINPALRPVFDEIADFAWKEVSRT